MRKLLISLMAASIMVPAAATARDTDRDRGNRSQAERSERADRPQRAERPAPKQRAERPARVERAPRAERNVRVERQVDRPVRVERAERPARAVRGEVAPNRVRVVQRQPQRNVDTRRDRDGFDGLRDRIVQNGTRVDRDRDGRRGDWNRDRDGDRRWSHDWRRDSRYDWSRHRNRYQSIFRLGRYYDPYGWGYRRFSIGFNLWPSYYGASFWLNDPWQYRLPPAYGPYRWVRYYDDAMLVNIHTGQVVDVVYNFFW